MRQVRVTPRRRAFALNSNESYETERLASGTDTFDRREAFLDALARFVDAKGRPSQPWLLESVIRTARGIGSDNCDISEADRAALQSIVHRYSALSGGDVEYRLKTFADVHAAFAKLFF